MQSTLIHEKSGAYILPRAPSHGILAHLNPASGSGFRNSLSDGIWRLLHHLYSWCKIITFSIILIGLKYTVMSGDGRIFAQDLNVSGSSLARGPVFIVDISHHLRSLTATPCRWPAVHTSHVSQPRTFCLDPKPIDIHRRAVKVLFPCALLFLMEVFMSNWWGGGVLA